MFKTFFGIFTHFFTTTYLAKLNFNLFYKIFKINLKQSDSGNERVPLSLPCLGESHPSATSNKNRRKVPYNPCAPSHW